MVSSFVILRHSPVGMRASLGGGFVLLDPALLGFVLGDLLVLLLQLGQGFVLHLLPGVGSENQTRCQTAKF